MAVMIGPGGRFERTEAAVDECLMQDHIYFIKTPYMAESVHSALDNAAKELGFRKITWVKTGCVITCHGGPGAFGIVGSTKDE